MQQFYVMSVQDERFLQRLGLLAVACSDGQARILRYFLVKFNLDYTPFIGAGHYYDTCTSET